MSDHLGDISDAITKGVQAVVEKYNLPREALATFLNAFQDALEEKRK